MSGSDALYNTTFTITRDCNGTISGAGQVNDLPGPQVATFSFFYISTGDGGDINIDATGNFSFSLASSYPVDEAINPTWTIGLGQNNLAAGDGTDYALTGSLSLPALTDCGSGTTTTTLPTTTTTTLPPPTTSTTQPVTTTLPPTTSTTVGPVTTTTLKPLARLAGSNRDLTAIAVSQHDFGAGTAKAVVLASDANYPDALVGGVLAYRKDAPVLLTPSASVAAATMTEIKRVLPVGDTVYVLGGTSALSATVVTQLEAAGYKVQRVSGSNRNATAVAVAGVLGNPATVYLATGLDYPYALVAGPAAMKAGGVVLLTNGSSEASVTAAYLSAHPGTRVAVGSEACAADPGARCVSGTDGADVSAALAEITFSAPTTVGVATEDNWPDALAASPCIALEGGPLLLVPTSGALPTGVTAELKREAASLRNGYVFGGTAAVAAAVASAVDAAMSA